MPDCCAYRHSPNLKFLSDFFYDNDTGLNAGKHSQQNFVFFCFRCVSVQHHYRDRKILFWEHGIFEYLNLEVVFVQNWKNKWVSFQLRFSIKIPSFQFVENWNLFENRNYRSKIFNVNSKKFRTLYEKHYRGLLSIFQKLVLF